MTGTITSGQIVTGNTDFNLVAKSAAKLKIDVLDNNPIMRIFKRYGVLNVEQALQKTSGDTVRMFNLHRVDAAGLRGDVDLYSNAAEPEYGHREIRLDRLTYSTKYKRQGTMTQQIAPFSLQEGVSQIVVNWLREIMIQSVVNQLAGNNATSISAPRVFSGTFTGSNLTHITGFNTPPAPTSTYKAIGALGTGSVTTDQGVTSSNVLRLVDLQRAVEVITGSYAGIDGWGLIGEGGMQAIALISRTGYNQLKADQVTQGQGASFTQERLAKLAGGDEMVEMTMGIESFMIENLLVIVLPDYLMPRGVHSGTSAAVAQTRRAVIVGRGALDMAFGKGFSFSEDAPSDARFSGFSVETDDSHEKMNKVTYMSAGTIWSCKKTQLYGFGDNAANLYDAATYVITHYSAT